MYNEHLTDGIPLSFSDPPALDLKRAVFKLGIVSRCFLLAADSEGEKSSLQTDIYKIVLPKSHPYTCLFTGLECFRERNGRPKYPTFKSDMFREIM